MSEINLGYDAAGSAFNLWLDGDLAARIPLAEALALAATICRTAADTSNARATGATR